MKVVLPAAADVVEGSPQYQQVALRELAAALIAHNHHQRRLQVGEAVASHLLLYSFPVLGAGSTAPLGEVMVWPARTVMALASCPGLLPVDNVFQVVDATWRFVTVGAWCPLVNGSAVQAVN